MQFLNFTYVLMDFLDAFKCFQKSIYEFLITFSYKDNIVPDSNVLVSYIGFNFIISQTQMETTLINNYVPSGNVEDIEHIDIETMEETERKEKFPVTHRQESIIGGGSYPEVSLFLLQSYIFSVVIIINFAILEVKGWMSAGNRSWLIEPAL